MYLVYPGRLFFPPLLPRQSNQGAAGGSLADAIAARASKSSGGGSSSPAGGFASEAMSLHFSGLMAVLRLLLSLPTADSPSGSGSGSGSGGHSVPPDLVHRGLSVLEASQRGGGLFRFQPFSSGWLQPFLTDALRGLAEGAHPLTREGVGQLVFGVAEVRCGGGVVCVYVLLTMATSFSVSLFLSLSLLLRACLLS